MILEALYKFFFLKTTHQALDAANKQFKKKKKKKFKLDRKGLRVINSTLFLHALRKNNESHHA